MNPSEQLSRRAFLRNTTATSIALMASRHNLAAAALETSAAEAITPQPFTIHVNTEVLLDLHSRLGRVRWPEPSPDEGWSQGTEYFYIRDLAEYWKDKFDWRSRERALNSLPQFTASVSGTQIHFVHARGKGPRPLPLVITHGWPSYFGEFARIIPMLTDPGAFGADPNDSFDVVAPSLPGFAFSHVPRDGKVTSTRVASLWVELMTKRLGYDKFCAHGGDIGSGVTNRLGLFHPDSVHGIHVMSILQPWVGDGAPALSPEERQYKAVLDEWEESEGGYSHIQSTRPQTLAYSMHDSPTGMAAWIVEKLRNWSDCSGDIEKRFSKDEVLTNLSLYWATQTFASSVRYYYSSRLYSPPIGPESKINVPAGIALTTEKVNRAPRSWAERSYKNIQRWTEFPRGGHFMAHEEPSLLAEDIRGFFRRFRG